MLLPVYLVGHRRFSRKQDGRHQSTRFDEKHGIKEMEKMTTGDHEYVQDSNKVKHIVASNHKSALGPTCSVEQY